MKTEDIVDSLKVAVAVLPIFLALFWFLRVLAETLFETSPTTAYNIASMFFVVFLAVTIEVLRRKLNESDVEKDCDSSREKL